MDGQRERLIVRGFDLDGHRANFLTLLGACGLVDGQAQLAVSDVCAADGIVRGVHEDARLTIFDIAVLAALRKDSIQKLFQIDLVGLCQIVENSLLKPVVTRVDGGRIDLEGLVIQFRAVQCKVLLGLAVVKDIALILQLDGEGDSLFLCAGIGGIIVGVEHLIICTLSQPKRSTCIIGVRALKCDFRAIRQSCRSVVCLNDVADRGLYFERSDRPFGGFSTGIVAVVCCLDGQRTGAYTGETSAAGDDEIHIFFQLCAVVCHDKRWHTGCGHIIKGRFIAIGECDLGIA